MRLLALSGGFYISQGMLRRLEKELQRRQPLLAVDHLAARQTTRRVRHLLQHDGAEEVARHRSVP